MAITYQNTVGLGAGWMASCIQCGSKFLCKSHKQIACTETCRFKHYEGSGDGCWEWKGNRNNQGYGAFTRLIDGKRKILSAHRESYRTYKGEIPDGLCVMHTCDNRICTNPDHLVLGTWADNNRDRSIKGRSGKRKFSASEKEAYSKMSRGSANVAAKLTEEQAAAIKRDHPDLSNREVAELYGVAKCVAGHIRTGRSWAHV